MTKCLAVLTAGLLLGACGGGEGDPSGFDSTYVVVGEWELRWEYLCPDSNGNEVQDVALVLRGEESPFGDEDVRLDSIEPDSFMDCEATFPSKTEARVRCGMAQQPGLLVIELQDNGQSASAALVDYASPERGCVDVLSEVVEIVRRERW